MWGGMPGDDVRDFEVTRREPEDDDDLSDESLESELGGSSWRCWFVVASSVGGVGR